MKWELYVLSIHLFPSPVMRGNKLENHIFIFCNQKLWVENPELLNLHKRLSVKPLIIQSYRPIFTICQHFYTLCGKERRSLGMISILALSLLWVFIMKLSLWGPKKYGPSIQCYFRSKLQSYKTSVSLYRVNRGLLWRNKERIVNRGQFT